MKKVYLDFENSIKEIETQIDEISESDQKDKDQKLTDLNKKLDEKIKDIYSKLTPAQITTVARHPNRPYTLDYVSNIFDSYEELYGDRMFADDKAIVGGLAEIKGKTIVFVGHQKGRNTKEKLTRNFGMPRPEGFRKALRLFKFAEKFKFPIITFIDTAGAYPGIGAEERGQSEAIGRNLYELSSIKVPVICNVIGEGGSGGALAIAVGDYVNMLEYSIYSVISPEGCSSILWKTADKASVAAKVLGITAKKLLELKIIDKIVNEPLGGAHRDYVAVASSLKSVIISQLDSLLSMDTQTYLKNRFNKIMQYGNI